MGQCETLAVSNLLAHKRAIRSLISGLRGVVVLWTPCFQLISCIKDILKQFNPSSVKFFRNHILSCFDVSDVQHLHQASGWDLWRNAHQVYLWESSGGFTGGTSQVSGTLLTLNILGNKNIFPFLSCLNTESAQIIEIFHHARQRTVYPLQSISCMLMTWWCKELGH